jgi:hypothetical protein
MNRRGFLGSILALGAAPAIVRAGSLMRVIAPPKLPPLNGIPAFSFAADANTGFYMPNAGSGVLTIDNIVAQTLRARSGQIAFAVAGHNVLLRSINGHP